LHVYAEANPELAGQLVQMQQQHMQQQLLQVAQFQELQQQRLHQQDWEIRQLRRAMESARCSATDDEGVGRELIDHPICTLDEAAIHAKLQTPFPEMTPVMRGMYPITSALMLLLVTSWGGPGRH
jgi:hypothetical protein